jgi:hypothetical protein
MTLEFSNEFSRRKVLIKIAIPDKCEWNFLKSEASKTYRYSQCDADIIVLVISGIGSETPDAIHNSQFGFLVKLNLLPISQRVIKTEN